VIPSSKTIQETQKKTYLNDKNYYY